MVDQAMAEPDAPTGTPPPATPAPYVQLTQVRIPLDQAAVAFETPDSGGRLPIVLLAGARGAVLREALLLGLILIFVGAVFTGLNPQIRAGLAIVGVLLLIVAVFRSFFVRVPEGARALVLRRGRYDRTIGPGVYVMPPWVPVSHLVTAREIPFDVPAAEIPTADGVRADVDILITFAIEEPHRFVFSISAQDFDEVCQAMSQDALRRMIRGIRSDEILDLAGTASEELRGSIAAGLSTYGVQVRRVVLTHVRPPVPYLASIEGRRIAVIQRAEEEERLALEQCRQAGRETLDRQRVSAHREIVEIEAANEHVRLERLASRLEAYPEAARWDFESDRLGVARALAANSRAMLQVSDPSRIADALVFRDLEDSGQRATPPTPSAPSAQRDDALPAQP